MQLVHCMERQEASIFKQLVGGDPLWANVKSSDGRLVVEGHYPVILSCNGKPRIHLDSDTDAWLRRLVVLSLKTPTHEQHFGKMAELILKTEASGILNWLLEGRSKLAKDKLQLVQTPDQKARVATILLASDSPAAFVRSRLVKKRDGELGVLDLYGHYQEWCRENYLRTFPSRPFSRIAKARWGAGKGKRIECGFCGAGGSWALWGGLKLGELSTDKAKEQRTSRSRRKQKGRWLLAAGNGLGVMVWPSVISTQTCRAPKTPQPD